MSADIEAKWKKAAEGLTPAERQQLDELRRDYVDATKLHTRYPGGPNAGILAELIRRGWQKRK